MHQEQSTHPTAAINEAVLVSVGCAVYNGAKTLRRALEPLVQQDHPHVEIIICDDGSTDDSRTICQEYACRYQSIRYIENEKNLGLLANFNKLFQLAKGKYFLWADQDDIRDRTYISKCVAVLESDPEAVLCHSHSGVFWKKPENLMHVNTIDGVDNISGLFLRYWRFMRRFSDTTSYGLIRSSALSKTVLWTSDFGSAHVLLFDLLLNGKFRQVPETLYCYSARGLRYRPSPAEEYRRANGGKDMPRYRRPFFVQAWNQTKTIRRSSCPMRAKVILGSMLWSNVALANGSKAVFRLLDFVTRRHVPAWMEKLCTFAVTDTQDIHFVVRPEENRDYLPAAWLLRKM